jgi:hypothetical protein
MYHYFMGNREKSLEHYHQRSNAETAFSQIKGKFGDSLRSKSDVGHVNRLCVRCSVTTFGCCSQITKQPELRFHAFLTKDVSKVEVLLS